jgi:hypothetical protein
MFTTTVLQETPYEIQIPLVNESGVAISDFVDAAGRLAGQKADYPVTTGALSPVIMDGALGLAVQGTVYRLKRHAALQLADRLCASHHDGNMPRAYWDAWEPARQAGELEYLLDKHNRRGGGRVVARTFGGQIRAMVSGEYGVIDTLPMVQRVLANVQGQNLPEAEVIGRSWLTADACQLTVMFTKTREINGTHWGLGVRFRTDEIGTGSFSCEGVLRRTSCNNSLVFNPEVSRVSVMHRGRNAMHVAWAVMEETIQASLARGGEVLRLMVMAERDPIQVPDYGLFLDKLLGDLGLNEGEQRAVYEGTEGARTVGGVINGITHAAKDSSDERSVELERLAAALLMTGKVRQAAVR